ncbi:MAG: hypothetical protein WB777_27740, partial [Mycobacterium sp.]
MAADDRVKLVREVAEVAQLLHQEAGDSATLLDELTESAVKAVPVARYAGITVAARDGSVRTPSSTGRYPELLDKIQQRHGEGPCLWAAWEQHTIRIDDLAADERWPAYGHDAVAQTPV